MGYALLKPRGHCRAISTQARSALAAFAAKHGSAAARRLGVSDTTFDKLISGAPVRADVVGRVEHALATRS